jgi:hypothetical protein
MIVNRQPIYIANEAIKAGAGLICKDSYGGIVLLVAAKKGQVAEGKAYRNLKANQTVTVGIDFRINKEGVK